ncbi:MAG: hypothetical protein KGI71_05000 [Patescibacteria group bacterium]|nr:hypothetical protein [Patescibacteria group bacterium]
MTMANGTAQQGSKKMEYKQVNFDVNEIAPDAPVGEWSVSIPRGKCKVQPTKEDHYPMLIIPIRLDKTEEEGEEFQKALGTELSTMIVFFGDEKARAARMSKLRLRQLCEAADVDLDTIPKKLTDPENDLEPLIRALEGKKFPAWTKHQTRKDTGEVVTELLFQKPGGLKTTAEGDEDEDDDRPRKGATKAANRRR